MQPPCMIHTRWSICPTKAFSAWRDISSLSWPQTLRAHPPASLFGIKVSESQAAQLVSHTTPTEPLLYWQELSDFTHLIRFCLFIKKRWDIISCKKCPPYLILHPTSHLVNYPGGYVFSILSRHLCTSNWPCSMNANTNYLQLPVIDAFNERIVA